MSAQAGTTGHNLPLGVGRTSRAWGLVLAAAGALLLVGIYAYSREASEGMAATGMRDVGAMGGATWGIYISFVVYFVGVSFAGITVAALIRLFNLKRLHPVARMAELLTVVALLLGALAILADLGQPLRGVVNLFRYARPQSPFFGTFSLVIAGYLFASLIYLFLDGRADAARLATTPSRLQWFHRWWASGYRDTPAEQDRHRRATFWLAVAIMPLLVVAHSTLGFVFGLQVGRPGWYSALQAPAFVVLAGVSGIGLLLVLAAILRRVLHEEHYLDHGVFDMLGKFLFGLLAVYLYFVVVEVLSSTYTGGETERRVSESILTGQYAWIYWGSVGLLAASAVALAWQALGRRWNMGALVAIGLAVNVAAIGKRFLIVVPSQTHGALLPYQQGSYSPTISEVGVVIGLFALGTLLFALFMKAFPILSLHDEPKEVAHPDGAKATTEVFAHA